MCRSRRELSNAYLLAKIGVDTAENEPLEVWGENSIQYSLHSLPPMPETAQQMLKTPRHDCASHLFSRLHLNGVAPPLLSPPLPPRNLSDKSIEFFEKKTPHGVLKHVPWHVSALRRTARTSSCSSPSRRRRRSPGWAASCQNQNYIRISVVRGFTRNIFVKFKSCAVNCVRIKSFQ